MRLLARVALLAIVASTALVLVAPASPTTVADCQSQLAALSSHTQLATGSFTNARDVATLVAKLDASASKLAAGKNADAIQKLVDYQAKLDALATASKVDPAVAQALESEAQGVVDCIAAIAPA